MCGKPYRIIRRWDTGEGQSRYKAAKIITTDGQSIAIKVKPRSKRYSLVGTAFDYLLRFELQRRAPHAISRPWIAKAAANRLPVSYTEKWRNSPFYITLAPNEYPPEGAIPGDDCGNAWIDGDKVTRHIVAVLEKAKSAMAAYSQQKDPTATE